MTAELHGPWGPGPPAHRRLGACTIWGSAGENDAASLAKGDRILVAGRVETDTWTERESGEKRTKPVVVVEEIATP